MKGEKSKTVNLGNLQLHWAILNECNLISCPLDSGPQLPNGFTSPLLIGGITSTSSSGSILSGDHQSSLAGYLMTIDHQKLSAAIRGNSFHEVPPV